MAIRVGGSSRPSVVQMTCQVFDTPKRGLPFMEFNYIASIEIKLASDSSVECLAVCYAFQICVLVRCIWNKLNTSL
jgi:hypothetical protein